MTTGEEFGCIKWLFIASVIFGIIMAFSYGIEQGLIAAALMFFGILGFATRNS
ncbi:MAG: hypothetical protein KC445_07045 [Anaerolineales bacterium]|nr:hypothetical protein [Anaerolineales bacterium]